MRRWALAAGLAGLLAESASSGFDVELGVQYAWLAATTYCPKEELLTWSCEPCQKQPLTQVQLCIADTVDETTFIVGRWDDSCVISIEGTSTWVGFWSDMAIYQEEPEQWDVCQDCSVHGGYLAIWRSVKDCVEQSLRNIGCEADRNGFQPSKIRVTGHSLGAGVAEIAMMSMLNRGFTDIQSYTFGAPRTGDSYFSSNLTEMLKGNLFRVTHGRDPIPHVPPKISSTIGMDYNHVYPEVFFLGNNSEGYQECYSLDDERCSSRFSQFFEWETEDHLHYMGVHLSHLGCNKSEWFRHVKAEDIAAASASGSSPAVNMVV